MHLQRHMRLKCKWQELRRWWKPFYIYVGYYRSDICRIIGFCFEMYARSINGGGIWMDYRICACVKRIPLLESSLKCMRCLYDGMDFDGL
jgi:hypothetical protein